VRRIKDVMVEPQAGKNVMKEGRQYVRTGRAREWRSIEAPAVELLMVLFAEAHATPLRSIWAFGSPCRWS